MKVPVIQGWVTELSWKMQTVLIQGLRAPDSHFCPQIKIISRWMRSLVLENADKNHTFMCRKKELPKLEDAENELNYCTFHFVTHFLYALEIISYKHPDQTVRVEAFNYYRGYVEEISHLHVETEKELDVRLSDLEERKINYQVFEPPKICPTGMGDPYLWRK